MTEEELVAVVAAARSIQAAAEKAVADLAQLVVNNRAVPAQIAKEGGKARQGIQEVGDQVLAHIAQGAEKAIREAAVSDVGAQIEAAMVGPLQTIDRALKKLEQSAGTANLAADRWRMFTRMFRWQQLAIAVLAGILMGVAGHWYFVTRGPQTEATEYLLFLKHGIEQKASQSTPASHSVPRQKPVPSTKSRPKIKPEFAPDPTPVPEAAQPPQ